MFCNSIAAVLMQIRLALSNLDPKPARLAQDWNRSVELFFVNLLKLTSVVNNQALRSGRISCRL